MRTWVKTVVQVAAGRVPVMAGAGSNNTAEALRLVQHAKDVGADAALVVTPYYNKPTQRGLYAHFAALNEVGIPIFIYNIPPRSVVDMTPETMGELAKLPSIVGVKDATADLARVPRTRLTCGTDFINSRERTPRQLGSTPKVAEAASASRPMSRPSCAPKCRLPRLQAITPRRWSIRTA